MVDSFEILKQTLIDHPDNIKMARTDLGSNFASDTAYQKNQSYILLQNDVMKFGREDYSRSAFCCRRIRIWIIHKVLYCASREKLL
jgi:hypothetical protein